MRREAPAGAARQRPAANLQLLDAILSVDEHGRNGGASRQHLTSTGCFYRLHRRRTAGEPRVAIHDFSPAEIGRRDKYVDACAGREYGEAETPCEVLTMGVQRSSAARW